MLARLVPGSVTCEVGAVHTSISQKVKFHSSQWPAGFKPWCCGGSRVSTLKKLFCLLTSLAASVVLVPSQCPPPLLLLSSIIGLLVILGQNELEELVQGEVSTPLVILKCPEA